VCAEKGKYISLLLRLTLIGSVLGISGVLAALLVGKELLTIIYSPEYAGNLDAFVWIMVGGGIAYVSSFLGYGMTASRSLKIQPFIFLISVILTYSLGTVFIPRYEFLDGDLIPIVGSAAFHCFIG
jgi:O-antigen/teichoic acid export membrane protein